jgi:uncharacterized protein (DUF2062 family)
LENRTENKDESECPTKKKRPTEKTGQITGCLLRCRDFIQRNVVDPLSFSKNPPWFDARGVAIGLFVALGIPIGGHTATLGLLLLMIRYNFPMAFAFTWIVNPLTVIPIYYGYYWAGGFLLGHSTAMGMEDFRQTMAPILDAGNFLQALKLFLYLDFGILERWMLAALLVSVLFAVLGYIAAYFIQTHRKEIHALTP